MLDFKIELRKVLCPEIVLEFGVDFISSQSSNGLVLRLGWYFLFVGFVRS